MSALSFLIPLSIYLFCLSPTISWGDSAKLALQAYERNLYFSYDAHFLHTLLSSSLRFFPFFSFSVRLNLLSALLSSIASYFLYLNLTRNYRLPSTASLCTTLLFSFSHAVFFVSTVTESYPLFLALLSASLFFLPRENPSLACLLLFLASLAHPLALGVSLYYLYVLSLQGKSHLYLIYTLLPTLLFFFAGHIFSRGEFGLTRLLLWAGAMGRRIGYDESLGRGLVKVILVTPLLFLYQFPSPAFLYGLKGMRKGKPLFFLGFLPIFLVTMLYGAQRSFLFFTLGNLLFALLLAPCLERKTTKLSLFLLPLAPLLLYPLITQSLVHFQIDVVPARSIPFRNNTLYFLNPIKRNDWGPYLYAEALFHKLPKNSVLYTDFTPGKVLSYLQKTERKRKDLLLLFVDYPFQKLSVNQVAHFLRQQRRVFISSIELRADYSLQEIQSLCQLKPFSVVWECVPPSRFAAQDELDSR